MANKDWKKANKTFLDTSHKLCYLAGELYGVPLAHFPEVKTILENAIDLDSVNELSENNL